MNSAPASGDTAPATILGLLEVLDRDGQVRQSAVVRRWPFTIGRALDNDMVLSDPNVAAHHFCLGAPSQPLALERSAATTPLLPQQHDALELRVGDTFNGVHLGARRLRAGEHAALPAQREAIELTAGRTRLRLRLPEHTLPAELPLAETATVRQRVVPIALAAVVLLACLLFSTYLATDPDELGRAIGNMLMTAIVVTAVWCSLWALLSKTFTRQAHFGWHLRVFLTAAIALIAVDALPALFAFALSWPWLTDYSFIATFAVGAAALYFHLLAVEPARHRLLKWVAATGAVVGVALSLWLNVQRTDRTGDELYMYHLFPPALRLAKPVAADTFIAGLARLKPVLDQKARESASGEDSGERGNDDE
ncbi:hypothetical protein BH11PSE8_BH11PSE8_20110 [soil metagenome]